MKVFVSRQFIVGASMSQHNRRTRRSTKLPGRPLAGSSLGKVIETNIGLIDEYLAASERKKTFQDRFADLITRRSAACYFSMPI